VSTQVHWPGSWSRLRASGSVLGSHAPASPPADDSLWNEIEGLLETIDSIAAERVHLVGFSAGGASCLAFASVPPDPSPALSAKIRAIRLDALAKRLADVWWLRRMPLQLASRMHQDL